MNTSRKTGLSKVLRNGASLAVLGALVASVTPSLALAQDAATAADPTEVDEVIVTGVRRALQTSQNIRRNADTVVDSITATDIGAFPDKSVAEALQRVPGITVNRFAASDDTSHFGTEPSGVLVRGLQQVRNEINGRDTFSANSSRGLGWSDISPELLGGVDVYKNQTAELIEGGIAGTVNLRTRVPFDSAGRLLQASAAVNYGDITEDATYDVSGMYSDRWQTEFGEFGFLVNIAHSDVTTQSQAVQYGRMGVFEGFYGGGTKYIPSSVAYRDTVYDRERDGLSFAGQWQDNEGKFQVTAQYNRSEYNNEWREHGIISYALDMFALPVDFVYGPDGRASWAPAPVPGSAPFVFDDQGVFQSGTMAQETVDTGWWGVDDAAASTIGLNSSGGNMFHPCYSWGNTAQNPYCVGRPTTRPQDFNAVTRFNETRNMTEDFAVNFKWRISDRLRASFDAQYVNSEVNNYDIEVGQYSFAHQSLDATGDRPRLTLVQPTATSQSLIDLSPGFLTNPNNYRYNHAMDHREDSEGDELALRADTEYDIGTSWLNSVKVGARYAKREQTVRYSTFNWGAIAAGGLRDGVNQSIYYNIDRTTPNGAFRGYPAGLYETVSFGGDYFGSTNDYVFFNMDRLAAHGADLLSVDRLGVGLDNWRPICERPGEVDGCFRPGELNDVSEETQSVYAMLKFGGSDAALGGIGISGNLGVRYVKTDNESTGSILYPDAFTSTELACTPRAPIPGQANPVPGSIGCYLSAAEVAFNNDGNFRSTATASHENWLPSLNVRFDVTDEWIVRLALSRAMSRPDIGLLKNFVNISRSLPGDDGSDPRYIRNGAGTITGVEPLYTAESYNPYLKPTTADQVDLALEYYFDDVGSVTLTAFYKEFNDYVQYGSYDLETTNNGVTRTVRVRGPMNGDGAKVQGFEVAYQDFFDFLPGAWSGLGLQANYTYVDNQGITNTNLKPASGGEGGGTAQPGSSGTVLGVDQLEGLSKHSFNIVGMYEKGPWAARVAYNWRSEFLVTAVDCCIYLPIYQDSAGFLDASLRYQFDDRIEFRLEGSNLLDTETVLKQQVNDASEGGLLLPNGWVHADRRLIAGVRFRY